MRRLALRLWHWLIGHHPLDDVRTTNYTTGETWCRCGALVGEDET